MYKSIRIPISLTSLFNFFHHFNHFVNEHRKARPRMNGDGPFVYHTREVIQSYGIVRLHLLIYNLCPSSIS